MWNLKQQALNTVQRLFTREGLAVHKRVSDNIHQKKTAKDTETPGSDVPLKKYYYITGTNSRYQYDLQASSAKSYQYNNKKLHGPTDTWRQKAKLENGLLGLYKRCDTHLYMTHTWHKFINKSAKIRDTDGSI